MGHSVVIGKNGVGIDFVATKAPKAVSLKTGPYPSFPTDLQAPFMALQIVADGKSVIEETVFENRMLHVRELQKMGAQIQIENNTKAIITGVEELYGASVIATDIRASCALVLAGMVAQGTTIMTGIHHWQRGYEALEEKLRFMGARIKLFEPSKDIPMTHALHIEHAQVKE
jgi:UDP-N-acetylglucosamine 1-carboxyvinyltransferase